MSLVARGLGLGAAAIIATAGLGLSQQVEQPLQQIGGGGLAFSVQSVVRHDLQTRSERAFADSRLSEKELNRANIDTLLAQMPRVAAGRPIVLPARVRLPSGREVTTATASEDDMALLMFALFMAMDDLAD